MLDGINIFYIWLCTWFYEDVRFFFFNVHLPGKLIVTLTLCCEVLIRFSMHYIFPFLLLRFKISLYHTHICMCVTTNICRLHSQYHILL